MEPHVLCQCPGLGKRFLTQFARVRFLTLMSPYVRLEGVLVEKCFRTVFTLELFHSEMSFYV